MRKSWSNANAGRVSVQVGDTAVLQEMCELYSKGCPSWRPGIGPSQPSTSEGMRVRSPIRWAMTWSKLTPVRTSVFDIGAPLSMFPVCMQWMTPLLACSFHRPRRKTNRSFQGASGFRHGPSSMPAPSPLAHQCCEWKPMPVKVTSVRVGG
ncbi:MAG: hypothetical protein MUF25_09640 [Pirellulaceae bacterium]|nr:hypothetical protein [Pirellulaceae bacterium]